MKCINRKKIVTGFILFSFLLTGCGRQKAFSLPYEADVASSAYSVMEGDSGSIADSFAGNLCVVNDNVNLKNVQITGSECAGLFDLNQKEVLYALNVHKQMNPASLTKIMTALLLLENAQLDDVITVTANAKIDEPGAQLCGLSEGDTLTVDQAMYALLIYSANDAAVAIGEHVAGSVEKFSDMMNERAMKLGATNTHFSNPHGLTASDHYTTAYDLYLIFNEVIKYDKFKEVIHTTEYTSVYHDKNGAEKVLDFQSTNQLLISDSAYHVPDKVTVIGGKTGTTEAAGACLILLSNDTAGNPYISVILKSDDKSVLYNNMIELLMGITS